MLLNPTASFVFFNGLLVDHNPAQRSSIPAIRARSSVAARVAARVVPRVVTQMLAMDVRMTDHGHSTARPRPHGRAGELKLLELLK